MRFATLSEWLEWQATLHPQAMELGLDRVTTVAKRLPPRPSSTRVMTVGGTNGKGSCVAYLEAILIAADYRVGSYTSPHLERYNERIKINGHEVDDRTLCEAFERVDHARNDVRLTYFEFGTLAALDIFWQAQLDVVVLEVGLGGRLDAVNIVDADCSILTNVALDHTQWLGPDRESIGREKAGIFRRGRPAICADANPPDSVLAQAKTTGAILRRTGTDYQVIPPERTDNQDCWTFEGPNATWDNLPCPANPGVHQINNAAAALAALQSLESSVPVTAEAIRKGIRAANIPGRFETLPGAVVTVLDVAHNPAAAHALARQLADMSVKGQTLAVFGMMRDKAVEDVFQALSAQVDYWSLTSLESERGLEATELRDRIASTAKSINCHVSDTPWNAWLHADAIAKPGDRIVVCGSFVTVAAVRQRWYKARQSIAV